MDGEGEWLSDQGKSLSEKMAFRLRYEGQKEQVMCVKSSESYARKKTLCWEFS